MINYFEGHTLLINKPLGWTSFDVVKKIRNTLKPQLDGKKLKVGHAGTLDPLADGLLIICTGKYTKKIHKFQSLEKEYTAEFTLGATRPSYDLETSIDKQYPIKHITAEMLYAAANMLTGDILQRPPIYSAIKQNGKRLYELARKGENVNIKKRIVHVYEFEITNIDLPKVSARIRCSKGTYIRSLADSFGKKVDSGAYLSQLTRTKIGSYKLEQAIDIETFTESIEQSNP
ncbi:MAG: tRNA pseudouridine(55) synthase TruB [Bacteroidota bacterium]|nr:tRNA pseudouridine(55) synthase TruB [Bacteroidota bacterium]